MVFLELKQEVRLEALGPRDRAGHHEPELESTAGNANPLSHRDVRGLL